MRRQKIFRRQERLDRLLVGLAANCRHSLLLDAPFFAFNMMMDFSLTGHATATHDIGSAEYAKHVAGPDGKASMTCA